MGKADPRCQYKTVTPKKWLLEILNYMHFEHPHVIPPTLDIDPT
jgi:hypothetical protein